MRKLTLVLGIMAVVCFVVSAYAQAPVKAPAKAPAAAPAKAPAAPVITKVIGTVANIDTVKKEITVKPVIGAEKVLAVGDAKITKAGKAITLADVKVGDKVTASEIAGKVTAVEVAPAPVVVPVSAPVTIPTK